MTEIKFQTNIKFIQSTLPMIITPNENLSLVTFSLPALK